MNSPKILIVEDERIIAMTLQQLLEDRDYTVVGICGSGEAAIEKAAQLRPDLVLMDINLEGAMDGTEAARHIYERNRIPVIFLTAYSQNHTLDRAADSTPFGYLVKPVNAAELHASIRMALARRAAEVEVEHSEERLLMALDAGELSVWEWDEQTRRIVTAGRIEAIFGEVPETLHEDWRAVLERVHAEDRGSVKESIAQCIAQDTPLNLVFRYMRTDSDVGWLELHGKAYTQRSGSAARLVAVVKDITERKLKDEQLRQANVAYETTIDGIFILDVNHRIISANPAFATLTGYEIDEVLDRNPDEFLHARRHSDHFYTQLEVTAEGRWQGEIACRRKSGEVFPVWERVGAVRDPAGAVTHYVVVFSDTTAMRMAEQRLTHLAHHDGLTGLPNRLLFNDRLDQALERARRDKAHCALLFIDLDGFKLINDTLGHSMGDQLLGCIAGRLKENVRASDTAARLSGDEFVVIAEHIAHPENAALLADKLLKILAMPVLLDAAQVAVSASIGIAVYPEDGEDRDALLKAADVAMYSAKTRGRNRSCFYTAGLASRAAEYLSVEQGLKQALEASDFEVHYQPLIALSDNAVTGLEALIRWKHPREGLLAPARFIPVAEKSGLIDALDCWVLSAACAQLARWLKAGGIPLRLAVNVSATHLTRDNFCEQVEKVLGETGIAPSLLEIEITESALHDTEASLRVVQDLKALGVSIAIDDFGTGYSSLSVLKDLPIDRLKIDRSFVQKLTNKASDAAIVKAIISMSRTLNLKITAEGVETEEQSASLRRMGCEEAQGYLFSKPMPFAELEPMLTNKRAAVMTFN